tara:strand:- start:61 stop:336 length:276 start_codon:yes stop_codon:yes gene_type:complete
MLYRLKKDIRPTENIAFFDSDKNDFVDGFYVENGVIGELIDQGKSCNKRHLTFWFDREKSIEFFGWKHFQEYLEPIDFETAEALMSEDTRH